MSRFVAHALLFALVQLAILAAAWRACPDDPDHYMAATLDKHARLRSAAPPRVIFVGGSSVGVWRRLEYGDFVAHRERPARREAEINRPWPAPGRLDFDRSIATLQEFAGACERAGARCFLAWSPVREARFASGAELFAALEARLAAEVALPMLERPAELAYPEEAFFDRGPHLTGDAAAERSRRLAARLAEALGEP